MVNRIKTVLLAGLLVLGAAFYISASTAFVTLLLGFLFVPPVLMAGAALTEGISILSKWISEHEKEGMVVSAV